MDELFWHPRPPMASKSELSLISTRPNHNHQIIKTISDNDHQRGKREESSPVTDSCQSESLESLLPIGEVIDSKCFDSSIESESKLSSSSAGESCTQSETDTTKVAIFASRSSSAFSHLDKCAKEGSYTNKYIGAHSARSAEALCKGRNEFRLYHRISNAQLQSELPLFIVVYRACMDRDHYHFRIVCSSVDGKKSSFCRVGVQGEPAFASLEQLIIFYSIYAPFVDRSEPLPQEG